VREVKGTYVLRWGAAASRDTRITCTIRCWRGSNEWRRCGGRRKDSGCDRIASFHFSIGACRSSLTRRTESALGRLALRAGCFQRTARRPTPSYSFSMRWDAGRAHASLRAALEQLCTRRSQKRSRSQSPMTFGRNQPDKLFAQHYAEAGLVEKSVRLWGKGRAEVRRQPAAMAEAAAQFRKGLEKRRGCRK